MGLKINEEKTKYMKLSVMEARRRVQNITIGEHSFEIVKDFVYLGSSLNNNNNMSEELWLAIAHTLPISYSSNQSCCRKLQR